MQSPYSRHSEDPKTSAPKLPEITTNIFETDLIASLAIGYLLIFSHFFYNMLRCRQQHIVENSPGILYLICFVSFYFLVSLLTKTPAVNDLSPMTRLLASFIIFPIFVLSTRLDMRITGLILFLVVLLYFIRINQTYYAKYCVVGVEGYNPVCKKEDTDAHQYLISTTWPIEINFIKITQTGFASIAHIRKYTRYLIYILIVIGLICYTGEMKVALNAKHLKYTFYDVLVDTDICNKINRRSLFEYFMIGAGVRSP